MNRNSVAHYRNPTEYRRDHNALRDQLQRETVLPLGAALIIGVLLSLGLWWTIFCASFAINLDVAGVGRD